MDGSMQSSIETTNDINIPIVPIFHYYENGNIERATYTVNGKKHKDNGPARIFYYNNGVIEREEYFINGQLYNLNKPAEILYCEAGCKIVESYYLYDKLHREDGPAVIYYKNGSPQFVEYYINNMLHRENGPAEIEYDDNGNILSKKYWYKDIKYNAIKTNRGWNNKVKKLKMLELVSL